MKISDKAFNDVSIAVLPPCARFNLRIDVINLVAASTAFGAAIPETIGMGVKTGNRAGYCIGPDEFLLHGAADNQADIVSAFSAIRANNPHSLTVISDREQTIGITGAGAMELLAMGCPLDLSLMAVGSAKRTVFDYAQVVLIRDDEDAFRMEVWRSFLPHVYELLEIGVAELATGL